MTFYMLHIHNLYFEIQVLLCSISSTYLKPFGVNSDAPAQQLNLKGAELILYMAGTLTALIFTMKTPLEINIITHRLEIKFEDFMLMLFTK